MNFKNYLLLIVLCIFIQVTCFCQNTFVIVHGAWGNTADWKTVDSLLTIQGNKVYRVTLSGLGSNFHAINRNIGLATHILDVTHFIQFENLDNVVLIGHSYGGMIITGVADLIPERIKSLVYIDALLPKSGESLSSAFGNDPAKVRKEYIERNKTDSVDIPRWVKDSDPYPKDVPQPQNTFFDPLILKNPLAEKIPGIFVFTVDKDKTPQEDRFYRFYLRAQEKKYTLIEMLNTSHSPNRDRPIELVNLIIKNLK
ncbi:MAG: alpha/beta hydrolase [Alphaproteobacteria bacterium]|nr:alpha/beta hydrolase [Alphaproteobacteria bacterium]